MDKKKSFLNIAVAMIFRVCILVCTLVVRRFLIKYIGNEANGLDSLYASIIGFLSVAELGIGTAITFCMYKPIIAGNNEKVTALYCLFKKLYLIIGLVILVGGCAILPLLPYLARGYNAGNINIYYTFVLMLISVVLTYAFSAKISLINAYKNNYISTAIQSGGHVLQYVLQIVVLVVTQSFVLYLWCRIIAVALQWAVTEIISRKKHGEIINGRNKIDSETKAEVVKNVKAMFMHKIGDVLVNTADSIIISAFIGVVILGKYSNYTTIVVAMNSTIILFFTPLTSIIGHMLIEESSETVQRYYKFIYVFNYIIGCIFYLGYYAVIDNLVTLCFGTELELGKTVSFIITLNYFIKFMKSATGLFRDSSGTFYNDRWKPLFEGILNVGLSIGFVYLFGYLWGEDYAIVGVIVATIITNLTICHIVEPYVLHKYAFHLSPKKYYIRNYIYIAIFAVALVALHFSMITSGNQWVEMFANGGISLAFSFGISALVILCDKNFRHYMMGFLRKLKNRGNTKQSIAVAETVGDIETASNGLEEIPKAEDDLPQESL